MSITYNYKFIIRIFFKYLTAKAHILAENPAQDLETPKQGKRMPKYLTLEESHKLLDIASNEDNRNHERDFAITTLFLNCGMRLSELVGININDIDFAECKMTVIGKGNKERLVPIGEKALKLLRLYIRNHRSKLQKIDPKCEDYIFLNHRGKKLTRQYVFQAIKDIAKKAGIKKNIHPHILRHSFATALIKGGANLIAVKEMMGHSSVVSTEIYTHLDTLHLRETLMLYHPHYKELNKNKSQKP